MRGLALISHRFRPRSLDLIPNPGDNPLGGFVRRAVRVRCFAGWRVTVLSPAVSVAGSSSVSSSRTGNTLVTCSPESTRNKVTPIAWRPVMRT